MLFLTLTGGSNGLGPRAAAGGLGRLLRALRRRDAFGAWAAVMQLDGRRDGVHLHVLMETALSEREVRELARASGFGFVVDARRIGDSDADAARLSQYLTRELARDGRRLVAAGVRPVRFSRGWPPETAPAAPSKVAAPTSSWSRSSPTRRPACAPMGAGRETARPRPASARPPVAGRGAGLSRREGTPRRDTFRCANHLCGEPVGTDQ